MLTTRRILLFLVALLVLTAPIQADLIDFEGLGLSEGDAVGNIATATNSVTFGAGAGLAGPAGTAFAAEVGGPQAAFEGAGMAADTPNGGTPGSFFLTDEASSPQLSALNYFISFAQPILDLSLDFYDYRADGGAAVGDTATLQLFSDAAFTTTVGAADVFTIPVALLPEGNVESLAVMLPGGLRARSAILSFSGPDIGTGIDNVDFTSAPEPWTILLLGSGLLGIGGLRRRKSV